MMITRATLSLLLVLGLAASTLAARCGGADRIEVSGGDVLFDDTTTVAALDYQLTSDNYRRWLVAQENLERLGQDPTVRLDPYRAGPDDIDRVVDAFEEQSESRAAIETAGLSVRDYVVTSIALAQSYDFVHRPRSRVRDVSEGNATFIRSTDNAAPVVRTRPRARFFVDDSDSDSDRKPKRKKAKKGKRQRGGDDSDSK